jgi:transcription initiation factor TFIIIB Brf1 subunit/transcription initiation factor TFIIB
MHRKLFLRSTVHALTLFTAIALSACTGASGQRAAEGAGTGALAGAAGGLVSGLLWGGDPLESAARGAVVGATTGAVVGGVSGAQQDKAQAQAAQQKEIEELRNQIGPDAFAGVTALAKCEHEVAEANARVAAKSTNSNYALAGLWVESISMADRGDIAGATANDAEIIKWDRSIETAAEVDNERQAALSQLQDIRQEFKLPRTCT